MSHAAGQRLFAHVVDRPDAEIELDVAALILGDWEYDHIDVAHYVGVLDELAESAAARLEGAEHHSHAPIRAINRTLFADCGFRGNDEDYYDPRNSFLHEVLDRRLGIPITLSVLYLEVGRRLGIAVHGVSFPGHFLVRYDGSDGTIVLDPFRLGMSLDTGELERLLHQAVGPDTKLEPTLLLPVTKRQILTRMLTNLAGIYGKTGDVLRSIEILERMLVLDPDNEKIEREIDRLRRRHQTLN
jgi:regulator of sirC expression with transglutaminase-like and TPR domain